MSGATNITELREQLRDSCHPYIEGIKPPYNYVPSLAAGVVFCVLFGLSGVVHTVQFIWKRNWWCSLFTIGCVGEFLETVGNFGPSRPYILN